MEEKIKVKKKDRGIDSFVVSIVSVFTVMFWYLCLPLSIYALVRSVIATKKSGSKLAKAAFIISLIVLTIHVFIYSQSLILLYIQSYW